MSQVKNYAEPWLCYRCMDYGFSPDNRASKIKYLNYCKYCGDRNPRGYLDYLSGEEKELWQKTRREYDEKKKEQEQEIRKEQEQEIIKEQEKRKIIYELLSLLGDCRSEAIIKKELDAVGLWSDAIDLIVKEDRIEDLRSILELAPKHALQSIGVIESVINFGSESSFLIIIEFMVLNEIEYDSGVISRLHENILNKKNDYLIGVFQKARRFITAY